MTRATGSRHPCLVLLLVAVSCAAGACRQMMANEPRYEPYEASDFFMDGQSARPRVDGTIAYERARADDPFYTGASGGGFIEAVPVRITRELLARGRERFDIFCSPCHGRTGYGDGMDVERGFPRPPSYHSDRLRSAPAGQLFDVITNGYGAMASYRTRVPPADRWAIVAYVRALQLSQNAPLEDVPPDVRRRLLEEPQ
jgi:mono/diheme cytochrome c family protein